MAVALVNGKLRWDAHWEHVAHDTPREDKVEYAYQNIRTKNYFWGDGDKVSSASGELIHICGQVANASQTLFWNDKVNYHKKDE
jgi:cytochrome c oxidase subunit 6a